MNNPPRESSNPYAPPADEAIPASLSPSELLDSDFSPIHITYTLTAEQYYKAVQSVTRPKKLRGLVVILIVCGILCLLAFFARTPSDRMTMYLLAVIWAGMFFFLKLLFRWRLKASWKKTAGMFDSINMVIRQEGLEVRTETSSSRNLWGAYTKFQCDDQLAILFLRNTTLLIQIIPRKAFSDDKDWHRLVSFLRNQFPQ